MVAIIIKEKRRNWDITDNNVIYAKYEVVKTSIATSDETIFVEGEFAPETRLEVHRNGDNYVLVFIVDGKEVTYDNIIVKIKNTDSKVYVCDDDAKNEVETTIYGEYNTFTLKNSSQQFGLIANDHSMPSYLWAIIGAGSVLVICGIVCLITYTVRKKKQQ